VKLLNDLGLECGIVEEERQLKSEDETVLAHLQQSSIKPTVGRQHAYVHVFLQRKRAPVLNERQKLLSWSLNAESTARLKL
jgi:hypothetical protein